MRREARQGAGKTHERFGDAEAEPGGDAEDQAIHGLGKVGAVRKQDRRQGLERLLHDRDQQPDEKQRAGADPRVAQRVADTGIRVVDGAFDQCQDESHHGAAADRESQHGRRLVAIDLRLVEIDQVEDGDEERRDEDRGRDEPGDVKDEDAGQPGRERPAELMDLVLAEMRKQGRENRRLDDVLVRVGGISVFAFLGVADLRRRPLVRAATGAKHAVRNVVGAVVAAHGP